LLTPTINQNKSMQRHQRRQGLKKKNKRAKIHHKTAKLETKSNEEKLKNYWKRGLSGF